MGNIDEDEGKKNGCMSDTAQINYQELLKTTRNCHNYRWPFSGGKRVVEDSLQKGWRADNSSEETEKWIILKSL